MRKATKRTPNKLVGLFFHTTKDGEITWQGHVEAKLDDRLYLVQFYSWVMGEPTFAQITTIWNMFEEGKEWRFYKTAQDWREAGDAYLAKLRQQ